MVGIIITGHGEFASGLKSSIELIVGKQENLEAVDFMINDSIEDLQRKLKKAIGAVDSGKGIVFFTDILGGSPFNISVLLSKKIKCSDVIAGSNLPAIINILFDRNRLSVEEIKNKALEAGESGIKAFSDQIRSRMKTEINGI
ncbi:PTS galactosamine/N-acetylgalactosamine transporter subunit IIA [Caloranaerobacter azorensis]|uniref:PTS sugar transporter subunit IIA n=1 Tax=Caloranaerobacter azorensis TaxID=116090 RepID=A0A6P1YEE6_9FIRM|nr:PTS galactosamine/N-acetylgalactosamine transporter subunit IIA [Caloranaerobacter azorensis]QIB27601.1 PTS sugar transporter subunit IIA [Caloranaerobacter azorensis]